MASMPFTETKKITLDATEAVDLYTGVILPPGSYPGTKNADSRQFFRRRRNLDAYQIQDRTHRRTACQHGRRKPTDPPELRGNRRHGICPPREVDDTLIVEGRQTSSAASHFVLKTCFRRFKLIHATFSCPARGPRRGEHGSESKNSRQNRRPESKNGLRLMGTAARKSTPTNRHSGYSGKDHAGV